MKPKQQIVINDCFGGFGVSKELRKAYKEWTGKWLPRCTNDIKRDDPNLVLLVSVLGSKANDDYSKLKVVAIPAEVNWQIEEYDGNEVVAEEHRTWC
jgi:hypothetical protein